MHTIAFVEWTESNASARELGAVVADQERFGICSLRGIALSEALMVMRIGKGVQFIFERRLRWVRTIAEPVGHLHSEGVTHRDLKPHNIILVTALGAVWDGADATEDWYLTDFGCAWVVESKNPATPLVGQGQVGTLQYMAPGVPWSKPREYDRVNVYELSWELLSGKPPFSNVPEAALREIVRNDDRRSRPEIPAE